MENQTRLAPMINLTLTLDDVRNVIAFGNRAEMRGAEADTWVALKQKFAEAVREANEPREEKPSLASVD